jgi:hypothetical protein
VECSDTPRDSRKRRDELGRRYLGQVEFPAGGRDSLRVLNRIDLLEDGPTCAQI